MVYAALQLCNWRPLARRDDWDSEPTPNGHDGGIPRRDNGLVRLLVPVLVAVHQDLAISHASSSGAIAALRTKTESIGGFLQPLQAGTRRLRFRPCPWHRPVTRRRFRAHDLLPLRPARRAIRLPGAR